MSEPTTRVSRRSFLFAVGAGGAVTAGAVLAKNVPPEVECPRGNDDKRATRGYHASRHVDAYYRTVKL